MLSNNNLIKYSKYIDTTIQWIKKLYNREGETYGIPLRQLKV